MLHIKAIRLIRSQKGLTLTELLIASALMGIVMLGVAGFSVSLTNMYKSTSEGNHLATRTLAAMKLITRDITRAVGTTIDRGIVNNTALADAHSLCLRHDITNTPDDFADDEWVCYFAPGTGSDGSLSRCVAPTAAPVITTQAECTTGASNVLSELVDLNTTISPSGSIFSTINEDTGRLTTVQISLNTSEDGDTACDPTENLCYFLESNVSPIAHSRN